MLKDAILGKFHEGKTIHTSILLNAINLTFLRIFLAAISM